MTPTANKTAALAFFDELSSGQLRDALAQMRDDAEWWVAGHPDRIPIGGTYAKDKIGALGAVVAKVMPSGIQMSITNVLAGGDQVVIEASPQGTSPSGRIYDNRNVFVIRFNDGLIASIREYYDTIHTQDVFFGA